MVQTVNSAGGLVARYAQTTNIDEPLAMQRGGTTDFYEADGLGSVTSLTDTTGAVAETYSYDSFGNTTASTGSLRNYFQYTGREFDTETNLYYYRARYYDPTTGRFISEDPVRSRNSAYAYVRNRPTVFRDSRGLRPTAGPCLKEAVSAWIECLTSTFVVIGVTEASCLTACILSGPGWPECAFGCSQVIGGIEDAAILICTAAAAGEYLDCKTKPCENKK